jgi:hypothetical protein
VRCVFAGTAPGASLGVMSIETADEHTVVIRRGAPLVLTA